MKNAGSRKSKASVRLLTRKCNQERANSGATQNACFLRLKQTGDPIEIPQQYQDKDREHEKQAEDGQAIYDGVRHLSEKLFDNQEETSTACSRTESFMPGPLQ